MPIIRSQSIAIKYLDYLGDEGYIELSNLESICRQYEIDQMNGISILDRLSTLKKEFYIKKSMKNR